MYIGLLFTSTASYSMATMHMIMFAYQERENLRTDCENVEMREPVCSWWEGKWVRVNVPTQDDRLYGQRCKPAAHCLGDHYHVLLRTDPGCYLFITWLYLLPLWKPLGWGLDVRGGLRGWRCLGSLCSAKSPLSSLAQFHIQPFSAGVEALFQYSVKSSIFLHFFPSAAPKNMESVHHLLDSNDFRRICNS